MAERPPREELLLKGEPLFSFIAPPPALNTPADLRFSDPHSRRLDYRSPLRRLHAPHFRLGILVLAEPKLWNSPPSQDLAEPVA
jgi:hypothetical protein